MTERKKENGKIMQDGLEAWLTESRDYYARRHPTYEEWDRIKYYTLDGTPIPPVKGQCKLCGDVIESKMCGNYQSCTCGKSAVDTDRWSPRRGRYIGQITPIFD